MTDELYFHIRKKMTEEGAWNGAMNYKVYTSEEFVDEFGHNLSEELKALITQHVGKLQVACDARILTDKD